MYIGKISSGASVMISKESPNQHLIISGISGVGKSVRIFDIERCIIEAGGTVIAFDMNGTHSNVEGGWFNYISAQEDGLDVKFLDTALVESGKETLTNMIQYVVETLCPRQLRGACQLATVRKAIQFAIKNKQDFSCEMDAIAYGLKEQDDACILRSRADSDAFQSGRYAEHNGRPETLKKCYLTSRLDHYCVMLRRPLEYRIGRYFIV